MVKIGKAKATYLPKQRSPFRQYNGAVWKLGDQYFAKKEKPMSSLREVRRSMRYILWLNQFTGDVFAEKVGATK